MNQDFTKRMIIVARRDIEGWQFGNTVGHIAAYLGNKMKEPFDTGEYFTTEDGANYPRNSQFPIIIKYTTSSEKLHNLMKKARKSELLHIGFLREMIDATNDKEIQGILSAKESADLEYLGVGVFGEDDVVNALTKKFSLFQKMF